MSESSNWSLTKINRCGQVNMTITNQRHKATEKHYISIIQEHGTMAFDVNLMMKIEPSSRNCTQQHPSSQPIDISIHFMTSERPTEPRIIVDINVWFNGKDFATFSRRLDSDSPLLASLLTFSLASLLEEILRCCNHLIDWSYETLRHWYCSQVNWRWKHICDSIFHVHSIVSCSLSECLSHGSLSSHFSDSWVGENSTTKMPRILQGDKNSN